MIGGIDLIDGFFIMILDIVIKWIKTELFLIS